MYILCSSHLLSSHIFSLSFQLVTQIRGHMHHTRYQVSYTINTWYQGLVRRCRRVTQGKTCISQGCKSECSILNPSSLASVKVNQRENAVRQGVKVPSPDIIHCIKSSLLPCFVCPDPLSERRPGIYLFYYYYACHPTMCSVVSYQYVVTDL